MISLTKIAVVTVFISTSAAIAYAAKIVDNDAITVTSAANHISLIQAITTAEKHNNGNAVRAEYETSKIGSVYDIEVISGVKVFDVRVDAIKGTIISSVEDTIDNDGNDKKD